MKQEKFTSFDKTVIQCYFWDDVKSPIGVVQISHGMAEHARRYDDFATYLNKNGFIVFADDHRAHGNSVKKESLGYQDGEIMEDTVKDELEITSYLKEKYGLPVVVLGHSYGSFIAQRYLQENKLASGIVLSGSACMAGPLLAAGSLIANLQYAIIGGKKTAKLLNKMAFGAYDKNFKKESGQFNWLSRDKDNCRKYCFDEQCGYTMSIAFYKHFFAGLKNAYKAENLSKINKDLKIALFSGDMDPVGGKKGALVKKLKAQYDRLGLKNVSMKLYDGARHEILNETNKAEVYADMLVAIKGFID